MDELGMYKDGKTPRFAIFFFISLSHKISLQTESEARMTGTISDRQGAVF